LCERGNFKLCYKVAYQYKELKNFEKVKYFLDKACDGNYYNACFNAALEYHDRKEYEKAKTLYKKACDGNYYDACYNYGYLFMDGEGGVKDMDITFEYYKKACEGRHVKSCNYLGILYSTQQVERRDIKKAIEYGLKACEIGKAPCLVGAYYIMDKNLELAEKYIEKNSKSLTYAKLKLLTNHKKDALEVYTNHLKERNRLSGRSVKHIRDDLDELSKLYPEKTKEIEELENSIEHYLKPDYKKDVEDEKYYCNSGLKGMCDSLAWAYIRTKELDKAKEAIDQELRNHPDKVVSFNKGHIFFLENRKEESIKLYRDGLKKMSYDGAILSNEKKIETVKDDFRQLSEIYPEKKKSLKEMEKMLIEYVKSEM